MIVIAILTMQTTTPMVLIAGAVLGVFMGTVVSMAGLIIGGCLAFLISRYFAREWAEEQLKDFPNLKSIL